MKISFSSYLSTKADLAKGRSGLVWTAPYWEENYFFIKIKKTTVQSAISLSLFTLYRLFYWLMLLPH